MILTSYFNKKIPIYGDMRHHPDALAISNTQMFKRVPEYIDLIPPWDIVKKYKKDCDEVAFATSYKMLVLDQRDVHKVAKECEGKILLCHEGSGKFCHRHLVAEWLRMAGYEIDEVSV